MVHIFSIIAGLLAVKHTVQSKNSTVVKKGPKKGKGLDSSGGVEHFHLS